MDRSGENGHCRDMLRRFLLAGFCLFLAACAAKVPSLPRLEPVADLERIPQTAFAFVKGDDAPLMTPARQMERVAELRARWFAPWKRTAAGYPADDVFWGFSAFAAKSWGQDLRPRPAAWMQALEANTRRETYPNLARPAVALRRLDLRLLPTVEPVFRDPASPGEGFPFDMNQNSSVYAGTPLLATHLTADGAWLLVEGPAATGFVPARDVAFVDPAFMARWQSLPLAAVLEENVPLRGEDGRTLELGRIGMLLPLLDAANIASDSPRLLLPKDDTTGRAVDSEVRAAPGSAQAIPLPLTGGAMATLIDRMLGRTYGWGGLYGERDCSALLQDLFAPFGVRLPRNSGQQARSGRAIDLKDLPDAEKQIRILAEGRPFLTLLTLRGHIMLYLGAWGEEPAALHAVWGLRTTGGEAVTPGRLVIGRSVVTSLTPGSELAGRVPPENQLLRKIQGMTFVE